MAERNVFVFSKFPNMAYGPLSRQYPHPLIGHISWNVVIDLVERRKRKGDRSNQFNLVKVVTIAIRLTERQGGH